MLVHNEKPIKIIGYPESSMTQEYLNFLSLDITTGLEIITPEYFISICDKNKYQYFVGFSLDMKLRALVCDIINQFNLDCLTYIHESTLVFPNVKIGKGCAIGAFNTLLNNCFIGDHCYIENNCLIAHNTSIGENCIVHAGTLLAGKTNIGKNCTFGFKSGVINNVNVPDNVNLGAFSNITKNISKPGRYVGTVARFIGDNVEYSGS